MIPALVVVDEVLQPERNIAHLLIAAVAKFVRYVGGNVLRPLLGGAEGNDPDGVLVLAREQIGDHGFQIGLFDIGFAVDPAIAAEVVNDKVHVLIIVLRDNRGRLMSRHRWYSTQQNA